MVMHMSTETYYRGRSKFRRTRGENTEDSWGFRFIRLLVKQTAAAAVCLTFVWWLSNSTQPFAINTTAALKEALAYELDFPALFSNAQDWVSDWFSRQFGGAQREDFPNHPETSEDVPQNSQAEIPQSTETSLEVTEH